MEKAHGGDNPFFQTVNRGYGESWKASGGIHPLNVQDTPDYKDLVFNLMFDFCRVKET